MVASSKQPWDARASGTRAVFPRRRGSPDSSFGMHEYISLLMTIANNKTEKETPAVVPAQAPLVAQPPGQSGFSGQLARSERGREGGGSESDSGADHDSYW